MLKLDNQTLLLAFIAVTGLAVLLQAMILLAIFLTIRKAACSISEQAEDLRSSVMPVVYNTRELLTRMAPKLEGAVEDLAQITNGLKVQTFEAQSSIGEVLERMRRQTARVDAMVTGILNNVDRAGHFVNDVVTKPVRQFSSIMASVKAVVETLRAPVARPHSRVDDDRDRFV